MSDIRRIGPVAVTSADFDTVRRRLFDCIARQEKLLLAFCNAHMATLAFDDADYAQALKRFLILPDGIGVDIASVVLYGRPFAENLCGNDLVPRLLNSAERPLKVFLLGSTEASVGELARRFNGYFPRHRLVGHQHGYFAEEELRQIIDRINSVHPDILFVAMGNPRQEKFIARHAPALRCRLFIAVGGLFDLLSGHLRPAPDWVRRIRMGWCFRLLQEPRRVGRRYTIGVVEFLVAVLSLRLRNGRAGAGRQRM